MDLRGRSKFFSRYQLKEFFSSPLFMALVISAVIIYFLPPIEKYKLELIEKSQIDKMDGISYYDDLDSDGYSEYIISYSNIIDEHAVKIMTHDNKVIDQWNFNRKKPPRIDVCNIYTGDYNNDGYKELFALSWENDSVFLDILCPMKPSAFERRSIFIDRFADYSKEKNFKAEFNHLIDIDRDGEKEIIFSVYAGFSIQPRRIYKYNIAEAVLKKSPVTGVIIYNMKIVDIDSDGKYEFIGSTTGPGNIKKEWNIPYRDSSSWLMVLNEELDFEFEPVEFPVYQSSIKTLPVNFNDTNYILAMFVNQGIQDMKSGLYLFDHKGNLMKSSTLPDDLENPELIRTQSYEILDHAYLMDENAIFKINENLQLLFVKPIEDLDYTTELNVDRDEENEFVSLTSKKGDLHIMDGTFRNMIKHKLDPADDRRIIISIKQYGGKHKRLFVQRGANCYEFNYTTNPLFHFSFLIYIAIILGVWLFMYIVQRIYRHQLIKQQALSRRISELQFNSINNQINPHFIFNAMNSITSAIYKEKKEEAYYFGTKFSNLMRETLMSAESISRTLDKEVKFVKDYLDLEKFRFKDAFDYEMMIDPKVDLDMEVPKTIIQTFAENAVKHGFINKQEAGKLSIRIQKPNEKLFIVVEDNGIGREAAAKYNSGSTGKGFGIIQQIFDLYNKLTGVKIHYSIIDLHQNRSAATGTRVEIVIENLNFKRVTHPPQKK